MGKVVLLYLPHLYLKQPDAQAPIGILYLASIILGSGKKVDVKNYSTYSYDEAIADLPEGDIYGITVTSLELLEANRFAKRIKEKYPKSKVILGGPGTYSDEFVDWTVIDSILKGEGEITFLQMISHLRAGIHEKIYHGVTVEDLNRIPMPARGLLGENQGGNIFAYNKNYLPGGSAVILTSRGCPFKCAYCSAPKFTHGKRVRFRSAQSVYDEVRFLIDEYDIRQFRFSDDMFTANKKHLISICNKLKDLDIVWRISCRVNPFDQEMAEALIGAGCKELSFGVESFDNNVLRCLGKNSTAGDNVKALELCEKVGIKTRILFMIRTPGQTKHTVDINIEYLETVPYNIICCTSFVPIPGSDIWDHPDKYNIEILDRNLDNYNFYFFGPEGELELKPIIKIKDRPLEEFHEESLHFKDYLKSTGKLNTG